MRHAEFEVRHAWDGDSLEDGEFARFRVVIDRAAGELKLEVDAAYYGDPRPEAAPGRLDELWNFEVVELFLLGAEEHYLEIELGPHGHFLGLSLAGRRYVVENAIPIDFVAERRGNTWSGEARLALEWLPRNLFAANAYAIHGRGASRRYLAMSPVPGPMPDFHRIEHFRPVDFGS